MSSRNLGNNPTSMLYKRSDLLTLPESSADCGIASYMSLTMFRISLANGLLSTYTSSDRLFSIVRLNTVNDLFNTLDPVVRRGDNFIPGIIHAIPRINFIPGLNCVARNGDKFILGIKSTQRLSRVKSLSRCFFVMKHYRKQFCRYTCFSNNIPEQHQHFSFSHESKFLSQGKENITK